MIRLEKIRKDNNSIKKKVDSFVGVEKSETIILYNKKKFVL